MGALQNAVQNLKGRCPFPPREFQVPKWMEVQQYVQDCFELDNTFIEFVGENHQWVAVAWEKDGEWSWCIVDIEHAGLIYSEPTPNYKPEVEKPESYTGGWKLGWEIDHNVGWWS